MLRILMALVLLVLGSADAAIALGGGSPPMPGGWIREPGDGLTNFAQAATRFEGKVYVFAVGLDGRLGLQTYQFFSGSWLSTEAWTEVPGGGFTDAAPAVASTADTLYLFVKGLDKHVWVNKKKAGGTPTDGWSGWHRELPAGETDFGVTAVATRDGLVYVFRTGIDGRVHFTGTPFGHVPWEPVPLILTSQAPAATYDNSTDTIFAFGVGRLTGSVAMNTYRMGEWRKGSCLVPGAASSRAVAATAGNGRLHLFYRGPKNDRLYAQTGSATCTGWSGRAELKGGGRTDAAPAAVLARRVGGHVVMVFVQGLDDGIYYHFFRDGDVVAEVTTRRHFDTVSGARRAPHDAYDYSIIGVLPGMTPGTACPTELAIAVHGWTNTLNEGQDKFQRALASLRYVGYTGPIVGFSWDANTGDWGNTVGFDTGKTIADGNGPKLANFIDDFSARCLATKIHLMGHSLGARVVLEAIYALGEDGYFLWNRDLAGTKIEDVHLLGAAVDNEVPQLNNRYGPGIQTEVISLYNYYADGDSVLEGPYRAEEGDNALGLTGIENKGYKPWNYTDFAAMLLVGSDHFAYWGSLDGYGGSKSRGVMYHVKARFN